MRSPERREVIRLLGSMQRFEVTEPVVWRASTLMQQYRRSHSGMGIGHRGDRPHGGTGLASLNTRHYPMFEGLASPF